MLLLTALVFTLSGKPQPFLKKKFKLWGGCLTGAPRFKASLSELSLNNCVVHRHHTKKERKGNFYSPNFVPLKGGN